MEVLNIIRLFWGWVLPRKFVVVFESFGSKSWLEKCLNSDFDSDSNEKNTTLQQATNMTIENPHEKTIAKTNIFIQSPFSFRAKCQLQKNQELETSWLNTSWMTTPEKHILKTWFRELFTIWTMKKKLVSWAYIGGWNPTQWCGGFFHKPRIPDPY